MPDDAATAEPSSSEAVEELLRQLVDARFVLTDRDGAVTRWSRPAEELFGWPGTAMLGRPLVKTLALPDALPRGGGRLTTVARAKDGHELEVALALVPVGMSLSLEFNGFLEALEIAAPRGDALAALGRSHGAVVDWIQAALEGRAQLEDDGLAAGTIIAFHALNHPQVIPSAESDEPAGEEAPRDDHIERALEDTAAELQEARENAEAARGEAVEANKRLAGLEEAEAGRASELADTRRLLEEMSAQLESLRGELDHTRSAGEEQTRADRHRLRREAQDAQTERERLRGELDNLRTAVEGLRRDLAGAPEAQERLRAQLELTREKVSSLETAVSQEQGLAAWVDEVHERLSGFESALAEVPGSESVEEAARSLRSELADARARVEQVETAAGAERARLEAELDATRQRFEQIEGEREKERAMLELELAQTRERLEELARAGSELEDRAGAAAGEEIARERRRLEGLSETRSRIERLESSESKAREHLEAELGATRARLADLAARHAPDVERLDAELAETRAKLEGLELALAERHTGEEEREELGALRGGALEPNGSEAELRRLADQVDAAAEAAHEAQSAIERLAERAEAAAEDAEDRAERAIGAAESEANRRESMAQERAHQLLSSIDGRVEEIGKSVLAADAGAARAEAAANDVEGTAEVIQTATEHARELGAEVEAHTRRAQHAAADARNESEAALAAARLTEDHAARLEERAASMEEQARQTSERLAGVEGRAREAAQRSAELGALADRAQSAASLAEEHALSSSDSAGAAAEGAARSLEASGAAERHADRAHESTGAAERHAARAHETSAAANRHADRAAEQAGHAAAQVRRMTEAADAAERRAAEALRAASSAERAAEVARRSAREAGAEAASVRHAAQGAAHGRDYEAPAPLRRFGGPAEAANGSGTAEGNRTRRPARPGFDDAGHPMAITDLDGHFRELNQAFCDLVGYSEEEFKAAVWPPVMDRPNLPKHREQMRDLLEGRIGSAAFNTGYVHAQGLLVPVAGTITLVEEGGGPDHFLLAVAG